MLLLSLLLLTFFTFLSLQKQGSPRSRSLCRFVHRIFTGECSQDQCLLGSEGGKARVEGELAIPQGTLKLGWPCRVAPNWSKESWPHTLVSTSHWIRLLPEREHHLEQDGFLQLKGILLQAVSLQHSLTLEKCMPLSWGGSGEWTVNHSPLYAASGKSEWDTGCSSQKSGS